MHAAQEDSSEAGGSFSSTKLSTYWSLSPLLWVGCHWLHVPAAPPSLAQHMWYSIRCMLDPIRQLWLLAEPPHQPGLLILYIIDDQPCQHHTTLDALVPAANPTGSQQVDMSHQEMERLLSELEEWCASSREAGAEWITAEAAASWLRNDLGEEH